MNVKQEEWIKDLADLAEAMTELNEGLAKMRNEMSLLTAIISPLVLKNIDTAAKEYGRDLREEDSKSNVRRCEHTNCRSAWDKDGFFRYCTYCGEVLESSNENRPKNCMTVEEKR